MITLWKRIRIIVLCILILVTAVSVFQGVRNALAYPDGSFDFQYDSAKLLVMKINPYDESLNPTGLSEELGLYEFYSDVAANQFPSLLLLLIPYTLLAPYAANIAWVITNLIMTALIIALVKRLFCKEMQTVEYAILACLMLCGTGWRNNIGNGQHTIFSVAFFLLAIWLSEKEHRNLSGLSLAIGYFKYTLTVPMTLYFIYKKKYREVIISVCIHIILTVASAIWLDDSLLNMIIKPLKVSGVLSSSGYIDIGSVFNLDSSVSMGLAAAICLILFAMSFLRSKTEEHSLIFFSILTYVSLIVIYHRGYDFFVLTIPVCIYLDLLIRSSDKKWVLPCLLSAFVYLYSNFAQKVIDILKSHSILNGNTVSLFTMIFAIAVYAIIVYQVVIYWRTYKEMGKTEVESGV